MKFSIEDFFSKCDQIRGFLRIWSNLLKKSLMENSIFCATNVSFLHPLKSSDNQKFFNAFNRYKNGTLAWNELLKKIFFVKPCSLIWKELKKKLRTVPYQRRANIVQSFVASPKYEENSSIILKTYSRIYINLYRNQQI